MQKHNRIDNVPQFRYEFRMKNNRNKKMVSYALAPDLLKRLDDWLDRQELPPSKTAVVEAALKAWLDSRDD